MTRPRPSGLVHSVQARLKNEAQARGRPFAELLELYAVERFLHRLGSSQHREAFVLKGALLLRHWLGTDTRPTRDVDLLGPVDLDATGLSRLLDELLRLHVQDDGIDFALDSIAIRPIRPGSRVRGLRANFDAHLGRTRLRYQVDVGLGDSVYPAPVELIAGGLLGLPVASVRAYTPYTAVAEKLEALVVLGLASTRIKDYYDLLQLSRALDFDGPTLAESMRRTLERRETRIPKELEGLSDTFAAEPNRAQQWEAFLRRNQLAVAETNLADVLTAIRAFVEPPLEAIRDGRRFRQLWRPAGPWRETEEGSSG